MRLCCTSCSFSFNVPEGTKQIKCKKCGIMVDITQLSSRRKRKNEMEFTEKPCPVPFCKAFNMGRFLTVLVGLEPGVGWHLSISHPNRYPSWDEISEARYKLVPNEVTMAMFLPPREQFVNIHKNCFHLFQTKGDNDV